MRIEHLGHACFAVTLSSGTLVVFDPYPPGGLGGLLRYAPRDLHPDLVLVTHEHADHGDTSWLGGSFEVVRGAFESDELRVEVRHAAHDERGGNLRGGHTRILTLCADGLRVVHTGDLGERLTPDRLADWGPVDALMLPTGGYYTLGPAGAVELVRAVRPRFALPCHYQTAAADVRELLPVERFVRRCESGPEPLHVERRRALELSRAVETSPEPPVVIVLEPLGLVSE